MRSPWLQLCCLVAFSLAVAFIRWTAVVPGQTFRQARDLNRESPVANAQPEIIQVSHESGTDTVDDPKVLVHVWMIELMTTSPNSPAIWTDFNTSLQAAVEEFNSQVTPQSGDFVTSDVLAKLIDHFKTKGKVTIYGEPPRLIANSQTDSWGESISITATPMIESSDNIRLSLSAAYEDSASGSGLRTQTTLEFRPGQTLMLGGGASSSTETKPVFPMLGRIPTVGQWLAIPITRTRSWNRYFLASPRLASDPLPSSEPD